MLRWIAAIWILGHTSLVIACGQADKDAIVRNNLAMKELNAKYATCTGIPGNDRRAECWQKRPLPTVEVIKVQQIVDTHKSLATTCIPDRLRFNVADFQLRFGRFCDAWSDFESIGNPSEFGTLRTLLSEAAITCARWQDPHDELTLDRVHQSIRGFVSDPALRSTGALRRERGRLLGGWQDVFYIEANANDDRRTASLIDSEERVWNYWEDFLSELRTHIPAYASALFPTRQQSPITMKQLALARKELR